MRNQRRFSPELKRSLIEELLSQTSTPAQICRRHNISSGLLYYWKRQYARGKFGNEPTKEAALADRVEQLERLVGQLTLEKELLKKALKHTLEKAETREHSFSVTSPGSRESKGGVSSLIFLEVASIVHRKRKRPLSKNRRRLLGDGLKPSVWNSLAMAIEG